jgi:putative tryptophan/tyrosine transport system substrate-binding protein
MNRRAFIAGLGGAAAWPLAAGAQQSGKVYRIGYISPATGHNPIDDAFEEGLRQHGWAKDQNIRIEYRYTGGREDAVSPLVTEVIGLSLDALVTWGPALSLAAKRAGTQIPLIFLVGSWDPVDIGLVSNLARPGANITGVTGLASLEIIAKRLQLLKELIPSLAHIVVLASPQQTGSSRAKEALATAANALGVELHDLEVQTPGDLEGSIRNAKDHGIQALYVWPSGFTFSFAKQISDVAKLNNLPSIHSFREGALAGGLLSYAADLKEEARRGAEYVDKILRGTPPGTLPVEQMSKYELLINLKTAKALGLDIPPTLLARADEVIE